MKIVFMAGVALAAVAATPASAADFSFTFATVEQLFGRAQMGSGVFTTSDVATQVGGQTAFAVIGIAGMVNGAAIVAPLGGSYGNYFTTGPTFLDGSGVNFNTTATTNIQFFNQSTNGRYRVNAINQGSSSYVSASSSAVGAVPEPSSWAMMLVGFGLIGLAARRRAAVRTTVAHV